MFTDYMFFTGNLSYHFLFRKNTAMQFFDTHAHIGLIYDDPIEQLRVITQARLAGVTRIVSINNSLHDFKKVYPNLKALPGIYHAVGVAPSEVTTPGKDWAKTIEESLSLPNVVAVGETGLDYYKQFGDKRTQMELFITQLEIAEKHNLPVIIHNRDAKRCFEVLKQRLPSKGAIFHCYSEDAKYAKKCLDAGFNVYFSFAGNLTYRNARNLHETVLNVPLDRILIETESPFMIPAEFAKKSEQCRLICLQQQNSLQKCSEIPLEDLSRQLWTNSCKIFNLPE